jgi:PBP1b-binding outer membrane lipoprotein LpoB
MNLYRQERQHMKMVTAYSALVIGAAMALAACSSPAPQEASGDAPKVAAVKCNRSADAPIGTMMKHDCSGKSDATQIDQQELQNARVSPPFRAPPSK